MQRMIEFGKTFLLVAAFFILSTIIGAVQMILIHAHLTAPITSMLTAVTVAIVGSLSQIVSYFILSAWLGDTFRRRPINFIFLCWWILLVILWFVAATFTPNYHFAYGLCSDAGALCAAWAIQRHRKRQGTIKVVAETFGEMPSAPDMALPSRVFGGLGWMLGLVIQLMLSIFPLLQLAAVADQANSVWGLHGLFKWIAAFVLTYIPIVGNFMAFFGARDVWHWPWYGALIFLAGWILVLSIYIVTAVAALLGSAFASKREYL